MPSICVTRSTVLHSISPDHSPDGLFQINDNLFP